MWSEGIQELENASAHCTDGDENNDDMDGVEVIDLCSVSRSGTDTISEGKESAMQESQDKSKHDEINKKAAELKTVRIESSALKSLNPIPYASDNGATKGDRRVQKHDDGRTGSDPIRIQSTLISSGDYLPNHKND